jgi:hypothetical protein
LTPISIALSRKDQCDLRQHPEHASARADLAQALGLDVGEQVIIRSDADVGALLGDLGVTCWRRKGWKTGGGAAVRWHITSTDISTVKLR